jgi:hypothetical protein
MSNQPSEDNEQHELNTQQARQGVTLGRMRIVLGVGIALVVVLFTIIFFAGP